MKKLLIAALILTPAITQADYKLGTGVKYDLVLSKKDGAATPGTIKVEVTAVDEKQQTLEITTTQTIGSETKIEKDNNAKSDLDQGTELIAELLKTCADQGGTPEKLKTAAGEFDTCKMIGDSEDGTETTWWANVPFFILKTTQLNKATGESAIVVLNSIQE